jgi:hypothetical protein
MPKKLPPTKNSAEGYWKKNELGLKIYYLLGKEIGEKFQMVKLVMTKYGVSSSKAHKMVEKICEKA